MVREHVIGVDFSGARDAGKYIWLAEGRVKDGALTLDSCCPARALAGGGIVHDLAIAALVDRLRRARTAVAGLDFPFSLPARFMGHDDWTRFVGGFAALYPTAELFRAALNGAAGGEEPKRRTDIDARTPFGAWNLRMYCQTWSGIAGVLAPLVRSDDVRVAPMQAMHCGKAILVETCPASLLKAEGLYVPYKGRGEGPRAAREGTSSPSSPGTCCTGRQHGCARCCWTMPAAMRSTPSLPRSAPCGPAPARPPYCRPTRRTVWRRRSISECRRGFPRTKRRRPRTARGPASRRPAPCA